MPFTLGPRRYLSLYLSASRFGSASKAKACALGHEGVTAED